MPGRTELTRSPMIQQHMRPGVADRMVYLSVIGPNLTCCKPCRLLLQKCGMLLPPGRLWSDQYRDAVSRV